MKLPIMESTSKRLKAAQHNDVIFPLLESWNPIANVATIVAEKNRKRILCRISLDVLQRRFNASASAPMHAVMCHREVIREAARALIDAEVFEEDGSVSIKLKSVQG